jgi:4-carboxymuconolactone decarboxylase
VNTDAQTFLEDMVGRRGYVHDFHRVLAEHDLELLQAYEGLLDSVLHRPRRLPRMTKELAYVAVLAAVGADPEELKSHMAAAASQGATSADILELLELVLPAAGIAHFGRAVAVWREAFES